MKSERAKELIEITSHSYDCLKYTAKREEVTNVISKTKATQAIELAEQDARERAIDSLCQSACENYKQCSETLTGHCAVKDRFLKHYDNGQ